MKAFHLDHARLALPPGHRFPISKYQKLFSAILDADHEDIDLVAAPAISADELEIIHDRDYIERVFSGQLKPAEVRAIGFPWSEALVVRSQYSVGATIGAVNAALADGIAVSLAGGTHHADQAAGAGFCVFNDIAVAAVRATHNDQVKRVLVIDCDVHQGDGSARMLARHSNIYTFSIHSARNYPHHKASSDMDIALPDQTGDADYLAQLESGLAHAFAVARAELVIYVAGADVYAGDRLGRLALTPPGIATRDNLILELCARHGTPVAVVMGGGYAPVIDDITRIHLRTVTLAAAYWRAGQRST